MGQFLYEKINLEDRSFRLIRLLKGKEERISCELFEAKFYDDSTIEYEPLSYTWGGEGKPYEIDLNNQTMPVTENLSLALRHLRHRYEDRILWIDAICIDQNNQKERGHQVRLMSTIYKKAERVVVWLGRATSETDLLFRYMSQLQRKAIQYPCSDWKASDARWTDMWTSIQPFSDSGHRTRQQREAFDMLLDRSWFQRVWIIQEVFNARSVDIMCGTGLVSSRIFCLMPSLMNIAPHPHCQAILDIMPGPSRKHSWWSQNQTLHMLLLKFPRSSASEPRDTVYALLGITSDKSSDRLLEPDYEISVEEVIDRTVAFLLGLRTDGSRPHSLDWTLSEFQNKLETLPNAVFNVAAEKGYHAWIEDLMHVNHVQRNELMPNKDTDTFTQGEIDANALYLASSKGHRQGGEPLYGDSSSDEANGVLYYGTALRAASAGGHERVVKLLLERIGDINAKGLFYYTSALQEASSRDHEQIVKMLLKRIANFKTQEGRLGRVLRAAEAGDPRHIVNLFLSKQSIQEVLWTASWDGDEEMVKLVLNMGVDVNAKDETYGNKAKAMSVQRHEQVVARLLTTSSNVTRQFESYASVLQAASARGHGRIVTLLLENNAQVNAQGGVYGSALQAASARGYEHIVKLLLESKAEVNAQGGAYGSALQAASAEGHERIATLLHENGAKVNMQG